jgi:hypothetical protein
VHETPSAKERAPGGGHVHMGRVPSRTHVPSHLVTKVHASITGKIRILKNEKESFGKKENFAEKN